MARQLLLQFEHEIRAIRAVLRIHANHATSISEAGMVMLLESIRRQHREKNNPPAVDVLREAERQGD